MDKYFRDALSLFVCDGVQVPEWITLDVWNDKTDRDPNEICDWVNRNIKLSWSTGISCVEAAVSMIEDAQANANIKGTK